METVHETPVDPEITRPTGSYQVSSSGCRFCSSCVTRLWTSACRGCARAIFAQISSITWNRSTPLHVYVCEQCFLVQLQEYVRVEDILLNTRTFRPTLRRGWSMAILGSDGHTLRLDPGKFTDRDSQL
jgi:hypothetical protein